jgi:hypothetical protein
VLDGRAAAVREDDTVRTERPEFDATTRPADAVREALGWAMPEVEAVIGPGRIDGFRFLRSRRELHVRRGVSTVTVYFSGSKWNATGHGTWLHRSMAIRNAELGAWRRAHPAEASDSDDFLDHVALVPGGDTTVWRPADAPPHPFADHALAELPDLVAREVLDAFETYRAPLAAVETVPVAHLTAVNVATFAEWARAGDRPDDAAEVLRVALGRRPILEEYLPGVRERLGPTSLPAGDEQASHRS